eukprot:981617-Ditylum_brightwellii.AAC.1
MEEHYSGRNGYLQEFNTYSSWAEEIMSLGRFRQIKSAYHPETGTSAVGDKCHQPRYLIQKINKAAKETFHFGPCMAFDEGGVATCSRFCC